jgi:ESS family glutamate:Na+ symporter
MIQTVAFAGVVLFLGYGIKRVVPVLTRYNIPAPVVGGLVIALATLVARQWNVTLFQLDTTLQVPLQVAFFTSVGFGASVALLRVGGPLVLFFLLIATVGALLQNVVGAGVAMAVGQHPLLGVLAGSVTLTGGPATGLAFAPLFEQAGVPAAATVAVAAAMAGIVAGGIAGGPLGTMLVERRHLVTAHKPVRRTQPRTAANEVERHVAEPIPAAPAGEDVEAYGLLKILVLFFVAMGSGAWVSKGFSALGLTLPSYIGAMLVAAAIRNFDDLTGLLKLSQRTIDDVGEVALALFLAMALMNLRLWELASLALPLVVILLVQVALVLGIAWWVVFRLMGRDYDAAVISSGFVGFMLGTTANAMANMSALVERYRPSPKAFMIVPIVGAFFIDFTNALLITAFLNFWR